MTDGHIAPKPQVRALCLQLAHTAFSPFPDKWIRSYKRWVPRTVPSHPIIRLDSSSTITGTMSVLPDSRQSRPPKSPPHRQRPHHVGLTPRQPHPGRVRPRAISGHRPQLDPLQTRPRRKQRAGRMEPRGIRIGRVVREPPTPHWHEHCAPGVTPDCRDPRPSPNPSWATFHEFSQRVKQHPQPESDQSPHQQSLAV